LKAKKYEEEADKEFEEAETEEEIEEIFMRNQLLANELEGEEVVEAKAEARRSKLDMTAKGDEYKGKIRERTNAMRLKGRARFIIMKARAAAKRLSYNTGKALESNKADTDAAEALAATRTEGETTITDLRTQVANFLTEVPDSGASVEIQTWANTAIDEGLQEVEDINKAINISTAIAQAKIDATNSVLQARKDLSKEMYLATTDAEVDAIITKANDKKAEIKLTL